MYLRDWSCNMHRTSISMWMDHTIYLFLCENINVKVSNSSIYVKVFIALISGALKNLLVKVSASTI